MTALQSHIIWTNLSQCSKLQNYGIEDSDMDSLCLTKTAFADLVRDTK